MVRKQCTPGGGADTKFFGKRLPGWHGQAYSLARGLASDSDTGNGVPLPMPPSLSFEDRAMNGVFDVFAAEVFGSDLAVGVDERDQGRCLKIVQRNHVPGEQIRDRAAREAADAMHAI